VNRSDLTLPENYTNFLGSFWADIFDEGVLASAVGYYSSAQLAQVYKDLVVSVNLCSVDSIPVYRRESIVPIVVSKSDIENNTILPAYGAGLTYGTQGGESPSVDSSILFGNPYIDKDLWYIDLPSDYTFGSSKSVVAIDKLYGGKILWINGVDFFITNSRIVFKENPFNIDAFPRRLVKNNGKDDIETVIWLCEVDLDRQDIFRNFGSIFSNVVMSSEAYKNVCRQFFSIVSGGACINKIDALFSAAAGAPMIKNDTETVIGTHTCDEGVFVETDQEIYKILEKQILKDTVVEGAILKKNFALTSAVNVIDTNKDALWWKNVSMIPAPETFSDNDIKFLSFPNIDSPISFINRTFSAPAGDKTLVRFDVIGDEKSKYHFWDNLDKKVRESDIDLRAVLPWTYKHIDGDQQSTPSINPAELFAEHIGKSIILPVKIDLNQVESTPFLFSSVSASLDKLDGVFPVYLFVYVMISFSVDDTYSVSDGTNSMASDTITDGVTYTAGIDAEPLSELGDPDIVSAHRSPGIMMDTLEYDESDRQKQFAFEDVLVKYRTKCAL
jgi:hypothetical protein